LGRGGAQRSSQRQATRCWRPGQQRPWKQRKGAHRAAPAAAPGCRARPGARARARARTRPPRPPRRPPAPGAARPSRRARPRAARAPRPPRPRPALRSAPVSVPGAMGTHPVACKACFEEARPLLSTSHLAGASAHIWAMSRLVPVLLRAQHVCSCRQAARRTTVHQRCINLVPVPRSPPYPHPGAVLMRARLGVRDALQQLHALLQAGQRLAALQQLAQVPSQRAEGDGSFTAKQQLAALGKAAKCFGCKEQTHAMLMRLTFTLPPHLTACRSV